MRPWTSLHTILRVFAGWDRARRRNAFRITRFSWSRKTPRLGKSEKVKKWKKSIRNMCELRHQMIFMDEKHSWKNLFGNEIRTTFSRIQIKMWIPSPSRSIKTTLLHRRRQISRWSFTFLLNLQEIHGQRTAGSAGYKFKIFFSQPKNMILQCIIV